MFELSSDRREQVIKNVGPDRRTVVVIDNFYKSPSEVKELAVKADKWREEKLIKGLAGERCHIETKEFKEKTKPVFDKYCKDSTLWKHSFSDRMYECHWDNADFLCNVMNSDSISIDPWLSIPHQDSYSTSYVDSSGGYVDEHGVTRGIVGQCTQSTFDYNQFGVVIFLNYPDECQGGTNLYSYKGNMTLPYNVMDYIDKPEMFDDIVKTPDDVWPFVQEWLSGGHDGVWNVEYEFKMVYNRMIMYESDVLHAPNTNPSMFTDGYDRINQVVFL